MTKTIVLSAAVTMTIIAIALSSVTTKVEVNIDNKAVTERSQDTQEMLNTLHRINDQLELNTKQLVQLNDTLTKMGDK